MIPRSCRSPGLAGMPKREAYRESVLPNGVQARLAVEAGATLGWERYAKSIIGLDHYGASAPYKIIFEKFGFTVENVVAKAKELIAK